MGSYEYVHPEFGRCSYLGTPDCGLAESYKLMYKDRLQMAQWLLEYMKEFENNFE